MLFAEPHHIIAIGASAGGMEEINSFFDHTPLDGVSYVIIQHLSADFKSRMVELLARHSKLAVEQAENGMPVRSNQVYLIPNDKFMTISGGCLYLSEKGRVAGPHLTINTFFESLAEDYRQKAIGVILSGLGSDGTEGARAIKKAGGMVIARTPDTTEFGSMPSHVIATGLVDFVLEPELMPGAIEAYVKNEGESLMDSEDDEKNLPAILELIKDNSPLDFTDYKPATILRRTKRRAAQGDFTTLAQYLTFLQSAPDEVTALAKEFLISVTGFFRDPAAFEFIQTDILPGLFEKLAPGEELKMWVAGCATGEEAYSLAILLAEQLNGDLGDTVVKIFATDVDHSALAHAGRGVYSQAVEKTVTAERLEKYFIKEGESYRVNPAIRKMVIFAQHDLVRNPPYCNMHLISCRNLLIYMAPVLQKKVFTMLLFGLRMNGYLFLGTSENPMPIMKSLEVVHKKWKLYRNLETRRGISFDAFSLPDPLDIKRTPARFLSEEISKNTSPVLAEAIQLSLAEEMNCLAVCMDADGQVIRSYGDTGQYLLHKHFISNLTELLPKPMSVAFNILMTDVLRTGQKAGVQGIGIPKGRQVLLVDLSVCPLDVAEQRPLYLVTFRETQTGTKIPEDKLFDEKIYLDKYTGNLEKEVKELKAKLKSAYERLDASNENMQSFNEELISANEEMQSTNEEMQSVNEELHTINADYQLKNKELLEINDDLNNYFRSNINGQLFINKDLLLMRFSPGTVKQINLLPADIGRPLSNISTNIKLETIIPDIQQVLTDGNVITKEIETNNGRWYQVMTMPYVQHSDGRNSGAIITFNDITELKTTQLELDQKNKSLLRINADLDHFIHAASHDLLAPLANIETSINVMNRIPLSDAKLLDFLNTINSSIKKFRVLITDIAVIAKVESDMITTEIVDIDALLTNITWSLEDKIEQSGAILIRDLEVKELLFSKKNLRSILFNLISNAIKFRGEEAPVLHISTKQQNGQVMLSVQDNGKGIPRDGMEKIFDMYGRLNQDIEGSGIGLYLARKIVNAAGGSMSVESEPGKGSRFKIRLSAGS